MDAELRAIADALNSIDGRLLVIDQVLVPAPRIGPSPAYMSGRWKLRDGNMYGR